MKLRGAARRALPFAVGIAVGTGVGVGAYALTDSGSTKPVTSTVVVPSQPASETSTVDSLTQLYKQDAPGVVDIKVATTTSGSSSGGFGQNPFGPPQNPFGSQKEEAEGTGFEIDTKGDILTAEHVVSGASSIKVQFQDGSTVTATLVGSDKSTDTAVIHVDVPAAKLHPLTLGNSASVQPGQSVAAIGSPFGLTETLTGGIVSATNRDITGQSCTQNGSCFTIPNAIQTDAAINHGNSGGPLIDVATNTVIGINDQIASDTNDNAGIGFAVPIDAAKSVAQTLVAGGTVRHAYMGVEITDAPGGGATVASVASGTPAARAGLEKGDVVTAFDGTSVADSDALTADVTTAKPGQKVTLTVRRNGATKQISVTLGVQPASPSS